MTSQELTMWQIGVSGNQIDKVLDGLSDSGWDHHSSPASMSPRETVEHLIECVVAFTKAAVGEKHEWGTFSMDDKSPANLIAELKRIRAEAVAKVNGEDEVLKEAFSFITSHDAYHVGQLCATRLDLDPNWNAYAIYEEA